MRAYSIFLFLFVLSGTWAQGTVDSLAFRYFSEFEKSLIEHKPDKEYSIEDFLRLMLATDSLQSDLSAINTIERINKHVHEVSSRLSRYNETKKVKFLFREIHDEYFKKYDLNVEFSDIFYNQTFNCVTASALYAYYFDVLHIPYQIKETPTHVFLVAYPSSHNIYVETTVPGKSGSFVPTESYMQKIVGDLVDLKLLTKEEVVRKGHVSAFNDYYYGNENIDPLKLVGLQYYNKALFAYSEKKYELAYQHACKSAHFYETPKIGLLKRELLTFLMEGETFNQVQGLNRLMEFAQISKRYEYLNYKFSGFLQDSKLEENDLSFCERQISALEDEKLRNIWLETLYSYRANRYSKMQNTKKTMEYAIKIYAIDPDNLEARNYISESMLNSLARKNVSKERIVDLNEIIEDYPFITEFGIYTNYQVYLYSLLTAKSFHNNRVGEGLEYLNILEDIFENNVNEFEYNEEVVGEAYGAIGAYYYRNNMVSKALEYLNRGFKYSPDNNNISRKIRMIKESHR